MQLAVMFLLLEELLPQFGLNAQLVLWALWLLSSVVSGSAVLALMHGNKFVPNDLDIYVPARRWWLWRLFLLAHRDIYLVEDVQTLRKKPYLRRYPLPGIESIRYFRNRKTNTVINVIVTKTRYASCAAQPTHTLRRLTAVSGRLSQSSLGFTQR
jgi:hypothetical protein